MRAIWQFFLYLAMIMIVMVLAGFAVFFIGDLFLSSIFMIIMGTLLLLLYTNLQERINAKMSIIEKQVEREQNEDVVLFETDPATGMTVAVAHKKHFLETQKETELLPPSDALLLAIEIASSLQRSLSLLDFQATYFTNFERARGEKPDLQLTDCQKQLREGLQQSFEETNYWSIIEPKLEERSLGDLINHAVGITPAPPQEVNTNFYLRDTPVPENALTEKYEPGQLVYEPAVMPAARSNYALANEHRLMLYTWPLLEDAQAFTQLPDTVLLQPGYYRVADQYTFRDKTMILLCFVTREESITDVASREKSITKYTEIIAQARAHFEASFALTTPEAFAASYWLELMKPTVGVDDE